MTAQHLRSVGFFTSPAGGAVVPHRVGDCNILIELITKGVVEAPDGSGMLKAGDLAVSKPGQNSVHRSPDGKNYQCLAIHFDAYVAEEVADWPRTFHWGKGPAAGEFAREVTHAFHYSGLENDIVGNMIWSNLRFRFAHAQAAEPAPSVPPRVAKAMSYIEQHLAEEIDMEMLATEAKLSTSHLHARFKHFVGQTPHQYMIDQRMRAARHLLATTIDPIKDIAAQVGFPSPEHFCRTFRRHSECTAAKYRHRFSVHACGLPQK